MGRFDDAKQAMRTRLLTLDPSPQRPLVAAHVYPAIPVFEINKLPVGICQRVSNREAPVTTRVVGQGIQRWLMWVDILLFNGPLSTEDLIAEADEKYEPWIHVMDAMLAGNHTLGGTVDMVGHDQDGNFFIPRDAPMIWFGQLYWGIRFQIPIVQSWTRTIMA